MSICKKRLIMWFVLTGSSVAAGIGTDLVLHTEAFPYYLRLLGLAGLVLAHFPLKRTGRLLNALGEPQEWGCTSRLVTIDIYECVRHPHHLGVGLFMTSLGLLIGHPGSFLIITITQWTWVLVFLLRVEEWELLDKFGLEYEAYRRKTPMLLPRPGCLFRLYARSAGKEQKKPGDGTAQ